MYFFAISLKNSMVYRWSVIFSIIGSIISIAISLIIWRFLYRNNPNMIEYMTKYMIISNIISMFYTKGIAERIGNKVVDGSFATDLIRPINFFAMSWQIELANVCSDLLLRGLPTILVYIPLLYSNKGYFNIVAVLIAVALGHVLFLLIYSLLGFSAFIFIEIWPYQRLIDDTIRLLSGVFIPLAILPPWINAVANVLPFKYLYSFPLQLLLENKHSIILSQNYIILIGWIVIFAVMNIIMYRLMLKKAVVQGG